MPNHCENNITITAKEKGVIEKIIKECFLKEEGDDNFDFNTLIPYPLSFRKQDKIAEIEAKNGNTSVKDGFNSGGYEWCVENWGTKWNAYDTKILKVENREWKAPSLKIRFTTAWSPPAPILEKLADKYSVHVRNEWYEEGGQSGDDEYGGTKL